MNPISKMVSISMAVMGVVLGIIKTPWLLLLCIPIVIWGIGAIVSRVWDHFER